MQVAENPGLSTTKGDPFPNLHISEEPFSETFASWQTPDSIIFADTYSYAVIKNSNLYVRNLLLVSKTIETEIQRVVSNGYDFDHIIAIGGCTALDFGRACAGDGTSLIAIPSILSTSCISVGKSIIYNQSRHYAKKTTSPSEVVINLPLLKLSDEKIVSRWTRSGLGDLFSNISATIDYLHKNSPSIFNNAPNFENKLDELIPETMAALEWVTNDFDGFNDNGLIKTSEYLYASGIRENLKGTSVFSVAGEHELYYTMMHKYNYSSSHPTHGELVSVGTLISARILHEVFGVKSLFDRLKCAYEKLGLPCNSNSLQSSNIGLAEVNDTLTGGKNSEHFLYQYFDNKILTSSYQR